MASQKNIQTLRNEGLEVNGGGIALYQPGDVFGPHEFHIYEFVWIMDGDVEWEVDGHKQKTPPGSLCLMTPGTVQTFFWDKNHPSRHAYFLFSFGTNRERYPSDKLLPRSRMMGGDDIYQPLFRHVLWLLGSGHRNSPQMTAAVHCLLETFISGDANAAEDVGERYPEAILLALRFARRKWDEGTLHLPSLDELARHAGVSRAQLYRHFMSSFGMGPLTAIRFVRLEEASLRLARNAGNIKQIAEATGFSSAYHFSKVFKDAYGISPKEFRARVKAGRAVRPLPKLVQIRQMKRIIMEAA
ncbi:AraC family transcriptional regulator [Oscillatoria amoena NRMC-F 0135]|nr:AraC family transcriptional regulator [Oscillatoria laete-virens]MDL5051072.1 AraC family transcriptional regulator [Oscillatoria amoena NRMC-F 0135]MDL5054520.1 AraC family transcriptional regulator [Oscillatoria laete-virens NRMC-F 0139]